MSSSFIEDGAFVNSIVGEGTKFNGDLDLNGLLRIDGDFTGSIKTAGKVLVGKNGRAMCTINASTVVVGGAVIGNIYSTEKVVIFSSGIIVGNIYTPRLIVEEGVILNGLCTINRNLNIPAMQDNLTALASEENNVKEESGNLTENLPEEQVRSSSFKSQDEQASPYFYNG